MEEEEPTMRIRGAMALAVGGHDRGQRLFGSSAGSYRRPSAQTSLGAGEGALNLVAWAGYVVGGTGGEQVEGYDWVTPFEQATGCKVTVKVGLDSGNMVQLMKTGQYDGVSASGDATLRLIAGGDVAPVNFDLIPNYKDVFAGLKNQSYNTVNGVGYGVPHGRGANVLMYDPAVVTTAPDSWSVVFDGGLAVQGQGHRLQLRHLHRGRGALPHEDQAGPQDHEPVRLDKDPARRRGGPAQGPEGPDRQVLGHRPGGDRRVRQRRHDRRDRVAVPGQHDQRRRRRSSSPPSSPRRAPPAGPTPG